MMELNNNNVVIKNDEQNMFNFIQNDQQQPDETIQ